MQVLTGSFVWSFQGLFESESSVEKIKMNNYLKHIAFCGDVCYNIGLNLQD